MNIGRQQRYTRTFSSLVKRDIPVPRLAGERRSSGYVLAECAIALCIVTAAFAGVYALMNQSARIATDMKYETLAVQAVQSEMERLRAMSWSQFLALNPQYALDPSTTPVLAELSGGKGEVRISVAPDKADENSLRAVSVRMTWCSSDGRPKEVALATLITPHGGGQ